MHNDRLKQKTSEPFNTETIDITSFLKGELELPIIVKTFAGIEKVVENEMILMGISRSERGKRAIFSNATLKEVFRLNYTLRTGISVLVPFLKFYAKNEDGFYNGVKKFDWKQILSPDSKYVINPVVSSEKFRHSLYMAQLTKDAISDFFNENKLEKPVIDKEYPEIVLDLHINENNCTLSLNSSGKPLYQRGYKILSGKAPLNESVASAIIQLSNWDKKSPLYDFFCGTGTLLFEAALLAANFPSQYYRKYYAFKNWPFFTEAFWSDVVKTENQKITENHPQLFGSDNDFSVVKTATSSLTGFIPGNNIVFSCQDFVDVLPESENGFVITNPPYGDRIELEDPAAFYKSIGDYLKKNFTGFDAHIFTANLEALKSFGLKANEKVQLFNGPIECRLAHYILKSGKFKHNK